MELNKIYLGDAYELIKQVPDKSVDLIYTDIPYLIDDGGCSQNPLSLRAKRLRTVELEEIRHGIDYSVFDEFCRVLKHIYIYIYGATKIKYTIFLLISSIKVAILRYCVGAKPILHH